MITLQEFALGFSIFALMVSIVVLIFVVVSR